MKKTETKWIGVLYAVVLIILATAGIFYCVKLKNNADPEKLTSQYAIEENRDSAEHQGDPVFDEAEVLDIGEGGLTVPLSDVSDEDRDEE